MKLATFGYRMNVETRRSKAEIFRNCLEGEGVSLLLDVRDSLWGGYWNPKTIQKILDGSTVKYLFGEEDYSWHKVFGAPHDIRTLVTSFEIFRSVYLREVLKSDENAYQRLQALLQRETMVAIMCCEEYVPTHDSCHRFAIADEMVTKGLIDASDVVHLNMDDYA